MRYIEEISQLLKGLDNRIDGVHAEDSMRKEKVAAFRKGEIPLLVTTTILERGVTVKNLQVAVLGAEEEIFQRVRSYKLQAERGVVLKSHMVRLCIFITVRQRQWYVRKTYSKYEQKCERTRIDRLMHCLLCDEYMVETVSWYAFFVKSPKNMYVIDVSKNFPIL